MTRVPSPDEIRAFLSARGGGSQKLIVAGADRISKLEQDVRSLVTKGPRRTTAEIQEGLDLIMQKYGMEPAEELVKMVMEKDSVGAWVLTNDQRIKILSDLVQYRMPKLKSVEVAGNVNHKHEIIIVRYGEDGVVRRESRGLAPNHPVAKEQPIPDAVVVDEVVEATK